MLLISLVVNLVLSLIATIVMNVIVGGIRFVLSLILEEIPLAVGVMPLSLKGILFIVAEVVTLLLVFGGLSILLF